jgi:hypothetical protein
LASALISLRVCSALLAGSSGAIARVLDSIDSTPPLMPTLRWKA